MTPALIQEVKKVNRQAALYLVKELPLLIARKKMYCIEDKNRLSSMFAFRHQRQGLEYWQAISDKLPSGFGWSWNDRGEV